MNRRAGRVGFTLRRHSRRLAVLLLAIAASYWSAKAEANFMPDGAPPEACPATCELPSHVSPDECKEPYVQVNGDDAICRIARYRKQCDSGEDGFVSCSCTTDFLGYEGNNWAGYGTPFARRCTPPEPTPTPTPIPCQGGEPVSGGIEFTGDGCSLDGCAVTGDITEDSFGYAVFTGALSGEQCQNPDDGLQEGDCDAATPPCGCLYDDFQDGGCAVPSPTPTPTAEPSPSPSASPSPSPSPSGSPTPGPSASPTPGPSPDPSPDPSSQPSPTPGGSPTPSPPPSPTPSISGGEKCDEAPTCEHAPVQCWMALEMHRQRCTAARATDEEINEAINEALDIGGDEEGDSPLEEHEVDLAQDLDFLADVQMGGAGCIDDLVFEAMGFTVTVPTSEWCPFLEIIGYFVIAGTLLWAAFTVTQSVA